MAKKKRESNFVDLWLLNMLKDGLRLQEEQRKSYVKFTGSWALFSRDILQAGVPQHTLGNSVSTLGCQSAVCRKALGDPENPSPGSVEETPGQADPVAG